MGAVFRNPWWIVFGSVLGLMVGNGPIMQFTFGVFLKPISEDLGWDRGTISFALVAGITATALVTPFVGRLMDRRGIKVVALPSILLFSFTIAGMAFMGGSPLLFILGYTIMGIAAAGQTPLPYAKAISANFDDHRGLALGIAMAGVGFGAALIPQVALHATSAFGWRGAYVCLGLLTFVLAFPAMLLFIKEPSPTGGDDRRVVILEGVTAREALKDRRFWFLVVSFFCVAFAANGTVAHVVPLLTDQGIPTQVATTALTAAGLSLVAGRLLAGYLLDRVFAPYVASVFFVLPLVGIGLLLSVSDITTATIATVLVGLGLGAEVDLIAFFISRYLGNKSFGEIYGYVFAAFVFGSGLGPFAMGLAHSKLGAYTSVLISFEVAIAIAVLLTLNLGKYTFPPRHKPLKRDAVLAE